ncbi:MAG: hypothetical protein K2Y22_02140 [Candidatus Obscuribacterales bacterium]|nr:hypothetical protein [Candidatus Obscuribacterales bacterium]
MTWNEHLCKAQNALAANNIDLAEIESALALKDAIAIANPKEQTQALQSVQSLIQLVDSINKSGISPSIQIGYQTYDDWDVGYAYAANHFQNKRYEHLLVECENLLAYIPPSIRRERIFYTKMMCANALLNLSKANHALPLFDDKDFRNWLKWNFDPCVRKNLQYASLYWQYLPALPIPTWLSGNPQLAPQVDTSQMNFIPSGPGPAPGLTKTTSILLWDQVPLDCSSPPLPCGSTQERFAHALFEQSTDLEAQAYRIVVTSVDPNVDYVESNKNTISAIKSALKKITFPRAAERLQLAAEKLRSGLEIFESIHSKHPRLAYWRKVLTKQLGALS